MVEIKNGFGVKGFVTEEVWASIEQHQLGVGEPLAFKLFRKADADRRQSSREYAGDKDDVIQHRRWMPV